jgi:arylsulfatase A-like enzyme
MSIYPTLCDLAGIAKPAHVTGLNIRPLLADPNAEWTAPALTTHGKDNHAIRTERWRYIRYADGGEELYDHSNDTYEWTNLASKPEHTALKVELAKQFPTTNVPEVKGAAGKGDDSENSTNKTERRAKRKATQDK